MLVLFSFGTGEGRDVRSYVSCLYILQVLQGLFVALFPDFVAHLLSDAPELLKPGQTRPTVTKCRLVEVSMVDIGGDPDVLINNTTYPIPVQDLSESDIPRISVRTY